MMAAGLLWLACCRTPARAEEPGPSLGPGVHLHAVVIGVEDFANLPPANDLKYTEDDALAFAETLRRGAGPSLRMRDLHILLGSEATHQRVKEALNLALRGADTNDVVIIYISTHGISDDKTAYLLAYDSTLDGNMEVNSLSIRELDWMLDDTRAGTVLVFVDACHSGFSGYGGPTGRRNLQRDDTHRQIVLRSDVPSLFIQTSSGILQTSQEGPQFCGGHGAYTCALMKALEGDADLNEDDLISLGELATEVPHQVSRWTKTEQIPENKGRWDKDLILSVVPPDRTPPPAPAPASAPPRPIQRPPLSVSKPPSQTNPKPTEDLNLQPVTGLALEPVPTPSRETVSRTRPESPLPIAPVPETEGQPDFVLRQDANLPGTLAEPRHFGLWALSEPAPAQFSIYGSSRASCDSELALWENERNHAVVSGLQLALLAGAPLAVGAVGLVACGEQTCWNEARFSSASLMLVSPIIGLAWSRTSSARARRASVASAHTDLTRCLAPEVP